MRRFLGALALALSACAGSTAAEEAPSGEDVTHPWLPLLSLRIGGGVTLPTADLASEDRSGFLGGQDAGFDVEVGVRYALGTTLFLRPNLSYYRFGEFHDRALPVLVGTTITTADFRRHAQMGGLRVFLEYIPLPESGYLVFLNGGIGLMYLRYDDVLRVTGGERLAGGPESRRADEPTRHHEGVVGGTACASVGIMLRRFEVQLSASLQEPSFEDFTPTWSTLDLGFAYRLPSVW